MATFIKNFNLSTQSGFGANPIGATGNTALATAFGAAINDFGMNDLANSNYATAYNQTGGFGLLRPNPDNFNSTFTNGNANVGFNGSGILNSCSEIDNFLQFCRNVNYSGQIICNSGAHAGMSGTNAQQANNILNVAKYCVSKGFPITHWESYNEPSGTVGNQPAADYCSALITAFANAGAPYNTYTISGPVSNNTFNDSTDLFNRFSSVSIGAINFHTYGTGNYANAYDYDNQILSCISTTTSYGRRVISARGSRTGNLPVFIGEYNMDGSPDPNELGQVRPDGGCFMALAIMDGIKVGNIQMMAIWHACQEHQGVGSETYGIINGSAQQNNGGTFLPWHIYPTGWILGRMANKMPGKVVQTTGTSSITISPVDGVVTGGNSVDQGTTYSSSGATIYSMATVQPGTANFGVCICNYNRNNTVNNVVVTISTSPASVTYWECGSQNLTPLIKTLTSTQLAAGFSIPPFSVVILSP